MRQDIGCYENSQWGDLLTSYDSMGNRTSYNGNTYTWVGRELKSVEHGSSISYRYNAEGIRTKKTVDGVTTKYFLNGSQILAETKDGSTIWYFYDSEGLRVGLICGGKIYYYMYNLQGDVVGIVRASDGKIAATYKYDAWGKCTVNNIENEDVGTKNPFRYKGYYYDRETGLYYLNSRYYSPAFGRFINADTTDVLGVSGDLYDKNLYAYCDNNPINRADSEGAYWHVAIGAAIGGAFELTYQLVDNGGKLRDVNWGNVAIATAVGGATALTGAAWGTVISGVGNFSMSLIEEPGNFKKAFVVGVVGAGASLVGSGVGKIVKVVEGNIAVNSLMKKSRGVIKSTVTSKYNVKGTERNLVKNVSWLKENKKKIRLSLIGKNISQAFNSMSVGISGYGTMEVLYGAK